MKKLTLNYLFTFLLFTLVISSCKKDDNSPSSSGSFTIDGTSYNTPYGYIQNSQNSFHINFADASAFGEDYSNLGGIQIICTGSTLESKTYTFDSNHTSGLVDAYFEFGGGDTEYSDPTGGSVTISKNGDIYDITYSINLSYVNNTSIPSGNTITGNFKGILTTATE
jgi:hypothetical protein